MITFIDDQKNISAYLAKHSKVVTLNIADHGKKEIMDMIQADDEDGLLALSSPIEVIRGLICTVGKISVTEDEVLFDGTPVVDSITVRILEYVKNGWEVKHLASFLNKLYANPSFNSRQFLHKFLEHKHLPISEDGFFLAYKGVTEDYLDLHTRTFDNSVGQVHTIERKDVDDNPANYCSYGFHVGSLEYATGFGVRTMIVKIDPSDVVSVPTDCSFQKMRVCKYEVISEFERPLDHNFESTRKWASMEEEDDDDYDDDYDDEVDIDDEEESDIEEIYNGPGTRTLNFVKSLNGRKFKLSEDVLKLWHQYTPITITLYGLNDIELGTVSDVSGRNTSFRIRYRGGLWNIMDHWNAHNPDGYVTISSR
jgi:hypothetical protein